MTLARPQGTVSAAQTHAMRGTATSARGRRCGSAVARLATFAVLGLLIAASTVAAAIIIGSGPSYSPGGGLELLSAERRVGEGRQRRELQLLGYRRRVLQSLPRHQRRDRASLRQQDEQQQRVGAERRGAVRVVGERRDDHPIHGVELDDRLRHRLHAGDAHLQRLGVDRRRHDDRVPDRFQHQRLGAHTVAHRADGEQPQRHRAHRSERQRQRAVDAGKHVLRQRRHAPPGHRQQRADQVARGPRVLQLQLRGRHGRYEFRRRGVRSGWGERLVDVVLHLDLRVPRRGQRVPLVGRPV